MGIQVHFKGSITIKSLLVAPKDKDNITCKSGVIYRYMCDRLECDEGYIGESPIYDNANTTGHHTSLDNFSIVVMELCNLARAIKEAMYVTFNDPSVSWNIEKYQLSHIWDDVSFLTPDLQLK